MPSENIESSETGGSSDIGPSGDRRTRKREARRDALLDLAADLVERVGVAGVTMAALADAADYAPASLYTYFSSRSALLAALQQRALLKLAAVVADEVDRWQDARPDGTPADAGALADLWAFSDLFLVAPDRYPREFRLQQQLLVAADTEETADAVTVIPAAALVLDLPRRLLHDAVQAGALVEHPTVLDPIGDPVDGAQIRTLSWIVALNGALMVDALSTGLPVTGVSLGHEITRSLLLGWGADPERLHLARDLSAGWVD